MEGSHAKSKFANIQRSTFIHSTFKPLLKPGAHLGALLAGTGPAKAVGLGDTGLEDTGPGIDPE